MRFEAIHISHWHTQMTTMVPDIEIVPRQQNGGALDFWGSPSRHTWSETWMFWEPNFRKPPYLQLGTLVQLKHSISSVLMRRLSHIFSSLHLVSGYNVFDCRLRRNHKAQFLAILEVPDLDPHFSEWCLAMPLEIARSKLSGDAVGSKHKLSASPWWFSPHVSSSRTNQISNLGSLILLSTKTLSPFTGKPW